MSERRWRNAIARVIRLRVRALSSGLAIATTLLIVLISIHSGSAAEATILGSISSKPHSLPPTLARWQAPTESGDYLSQIVPTRAGYLVWSEFPIKIYLGSLKATGDLDRTQRWIDEVLAAVREWSIYLPIVVVESPKMADITIWRSSPPLRISPGGTIARARSAETRYKLYIKSLSAATDILSHRCTIWLSPNQTIEYIRSSARHEIGHALGIWGHSLLATDVMYFSQVRHPPQISPRDVSTLKRVYEQPTLLGWPVGR
jgi:predicted Zn-dependent protease